MACPAWPIRTNPRPLEARLVLSQLSFPLVEIVEITPDVAEAAESAMRRRGSIVIRTLAGVTGSIVACFLVFALSSRVTTPVSMDGVAVLGLAACSCCFTRLLDWLSFHLSNKRAGGMLPSLRRTRFQRTPSGVNYACYCRTGGRTLRSGVTLAAFSFSGLWIDAVSLSQCGCCRCVRKTRFNSCWNRAKNPGVRDNN